MNEEIRPVKNYLIYDFVRFTAIPALLVLRPKLVYESEKAKEKIRGGALLISNHTGFFDPVHLMLSIRYRRHHFVCIKDFFEGNRFKRWLFRQFHCIPIDRENFSMGSLRRITDELKEGHLVTMFPEGHVNAGGDIAPFKSGMILLSLQSGCPIIPIYIRPPKRLFERLIAAVGEPVDVRALYGQRPSLRDIDAAAETLREKELILKNICCPSGKEVKEGGK